MQSFLTHDRQISQSTELFLKQWNVEFPELSSVQFYAYGTLSLYLNIQSVHSNLAYNQSKPTSWGILL
jgi:hypothetical protein